MSENVSPSVPQPLRFYPAMRTSAFENHNLVENYIEFWVMLRVDDKEDAWRVMHYMLYNIGEEDGRFAAEQIGRVDFTGEEALRRIAELEYVAENTPMSEPVDMSVYDGSSYPEVRVHFHDITHFREAAYVEGYVFDRNNKPFRRHRGLLFNTGIFSQKNVRASIEMEGQDSGRAIPAVLEPGVLSDIFNHSFSRLDAFSNVLKAMETMAKMDSFFEEVALFYIGVRRLLGESAPDLSQVEGLTDEDKTVILSRINKVIASDLSNELDVGALVSWAVPRMEKAIGALEDVYTEPFEKLVKECSLYASLLYTVHCYADMEKKSLSPAEANFVLETHHRALNALEAAKSEFLDLGGSQDQVDQLNAWVLSKERLQPPPFLKKILDRYYVKRQKTMLQVLTKRQTALDAQVMPAELRPVIEPGEAEVKADPSASGRKQNTSGNAPGKR